MLCCAALRAASAPIVFAPAQHARTQTHVIDPCCTRLWGRRAAMVRTCKQRRGPPHGFAGQIAPRCLLNHLGEDGALGSLFVAALLVYLAASSIASVRMARLARCTLLAMQDSTACCSNDKRHRVRHCCPWKTPPCLPSWARRRLFFVRLERGRRWRLRRHVFRWRHRSLPRAPRRRMFQKTLRRVHVGSM